MHRGYLCRNDRGGVKAQTHKHVRAFACQPPSIVRDDTDRAPPTPAWVSGAVGSVDAVLSCGTLPRTRGAPVARQDSMGFPPTERRMAAWRRFGVRTPR